jgi:type 2A phosphatase activator TIP41
MVFPLAHVVLERRQRGDLFVSWDAMDALKEWGEAHQAIPLPDTTTATTNDSSNEEGTAVSFRGVSVLQSSDATLWKRKQQQQDQESSTATATSTATSVVGSTTFHYDWTYSTPFSGKVYGTRLRQRWKSLETSGMPMHLLTDQSVPILYFDQILLYEDDLHDNGQVEYIVKVRVMPTCAYILSKLFLRLDNVLLRVRECRLLVEFETQTLYRDITWRECAWADLASHNLPTDVRAWTTQEQHKETPAFAYLLSTLPLVTELPRDLPKHAELSYAKNTPQHERTATARQP